jgi:hypothetical protein
MMLIRWGFVLVTKPGTVKKRGDVQATFKARRPVRTACHAAWFQKLNPFVNRRCIFIFGPPIRVTVETVSIRNNLAVSTLRSSALPDVTASLPKS